MPRRVHQISTLSLEGFKELECAEKGGTRPPRGNPPPMCVFVMSKETLLPAQEDLGSKALETWKLEPFFLCSIAQVRNWPWREVCWRNLAST